jgi:hypothetical protein
MTDPREGKDRLGDKLRDAEKAREDQYFAKRDKELLQKLKERMEKDKHPKAPSA